MLLDLFSEARSPHIHKAMEEALGDRDRKPLRFKISRSLWDNLCEGFSSGVKLKFTNDVEELEFKEFMKYWKIPERKFRKKPY